MKPFKTFDGNNKGKLLETFGKMEKAKERYKKAVEIAPTNVVFMSNLENLVGSGEGDEKDD